MIFRVVTCSTEGHPHESSGEDSNYIDVYLPRPHVYIGPEDTDEYVSECIDPVDIPDFKHECSEEWSIGWYKCTCGEPWTVDHAKTVKETY